MPSSQSPWAALTAIENRRWTTSATRSNGLWRSCARPAILGSSKDVGATSSWPSARSSHNHLSRLCEMWLAQLARAGGGEYILAPHLPIAGAIPTRSARGARGLNLGLRRAAQRIRHLGHLAAQIGKLQRG